MKVFVKGVSVPVLMFGTALALGGCSLSMPSLSSLPFFGDDTEEQEAGEQETEQQEAAETSVDSKRRFVRATPKEKPAMSDGSQTDSGQADSGQTDRSESDGGEKEAEATESAEEGETMEAGEAKIASPWVNPDAPVGGDSDASGTSGSMIEDDGMRDGRDKDMADSGAGAEGRQPSIPIQLMRKNPLDSQMAAADGGTAKAKDAAAAMTRQAAASRPEKIIRAHLASLASESGARREWRDLSQKHVDLLFGVADHIKEVDLPGKGRFFRLFAGKFGSLTDAAAFCTAMKERKQYCAPMAVEQ